MSTKKLIAPLAALVVTVSLVVGGNYGLRLEQERVERTQRDRVISKVGELRAALEGELDSTLYLTNGLTAYVTANARLDGKVAQSMLKTLHSQGRHVRNIGLAPGNRLTYIYPIAGNQSAIGLYYPDIPDQWPAIRKAIQDGRPILAGPLHLKQGGVGLIYRVPVFNNPGGDYWGILSMVIDLPGLMAQVGIAPVVGDLNVALRGRDGLGEAGETFLGDPAIFAKDSIKATISVPNGSWQIAARPVNGWQVEGHIVGWRISLWTIAMVMGVFVYSFLASFLRLKIAERKIRADHDELNDAQRIATLGSWVIHLPENRLEWSDEAHRIFGVPIGTPLTLDSFVDRIHPADRDVVLEAWAAALRGETYDIEHRIVVDGQEKWVRERAAVQFDAAGAPVRGMGTVLDITSRKLAAAELEMAKMRLSLALDASSLSTWDFDLETGTVSLDKRWMKTLGMENGPTSVQIQDLMGRLHEDDAERAIASAMKTLKGEAARFDEEFRIQTARGEWRWIQCTGLVAERDESGRARRAIGTNLDVSERKAAEEKIRQLAYYDALTGLPNRRLLLDRLQQALAHAKRNSRSMAIMFLDLDNFKAINDNLGHDVGDDLLKNVALRLRECVRSGDTVSRQGGDEFVIVLAELTQPSDAARVANKIIQALGQSFQLSARELHVTTSIGISVYQPGERRDVVDLLKHADAAMYEAKKAGRNRFCFFQAPLPDLHE